MSKNNIVQLTGVQTRELKRLVKFGKGLAREITRARILLLANIGTRNQEIAEKLHVSISTVYTVRNRFLTKKSISSLEEKPRRGKPRKLDYITSALIKCLASSEPPEGHKRWTLRLLAERAAKIELVDSISHESIRKVLKERVNTAHYV